MKLVKEKWYSTAGEQRGKASYRNEHENRQDTSSQQLERQMRSQFICQLQVLTNWKGLILPQPATIRFAGQLTGSKN